MRQKINENPVFQAAIIGVLLVAFAVVYMTQIAGGGEEEAAAPAETTPATAETTAATAETPAAAPDGSIPLPPADSSGAALPPATVAGTAPFKAGPGLPEDIVAAHDSGKTVVLLVLRANGIDDRRMKKIVDDLDDPQVAVFKTRINEIERYSRITIGLNVDRAPALIIIRPKGFDVDGQPQASRVYGLQSRRSTAQRVRDAIYKGPDDLPYHPG